MIFTSMPEIGDEEKTAMQKVIDDDEMLVNGKQVKLFEQEFAEYIGTKYAIAVNSGTDALTISQWCLGINKEVITSPLSFKATPESIILAGGKPKFVDVNPITCNIDSKEIYRNITKDTEAIIPVHLYGLPCDMKSIMKIADENNLFVIEDSCQAHGAKYKGKRCGSIGDTGCFSFYATKNMTTGGNGGMITTNDRGVMELACKFREHGGPDDGNFIGLNSRMNTFMGAIGRVQLKKLDRFNKKRNSIAKQYYEGLEDTYVNLPLMDNGRVFHLYVASFQDREFMKQELKKKNIFCGVHYKEPLHKFSCFKDNGKTLLGAEEFTRHNLSLPCHPRLSNDDISFVCKNIKEVGKKHEHRCNRNR